MASTSEIIKIAIALVRYAPFTIPGVVLQAISKAIVNKSAEKIVDLLQNTRYPIIFNGHIINYAAPCGRCPHCDSIMFRLLDDPNKAYCPGCQRIYPDDSIFMYV